MINSPRTNAVFDNMALPQRVRLKISPVGEAHVDLAEVASVTLREGADILVVLRGGEWWFDVLDTPENRTALRPVLETPTPCGYLPDAALWSPFIVKAACVCGADAGGIHARGCPVWIDNPSVMGKLPCPDCGGSFRSLRDGLCAVCEHWAKRESK